MTICHGLELYLFPSTMIYLYNFLPLLEVFPLPTIFCSLHFLTNRTNKRYFYSRYLFFVLEWGMIIRRRFCVTYNLLLLTIFRCAISSNLTLISFVLHPGCIKLRTSTNNLLISLFSCNLHDVTHTNACCRALPIYCYIQWKKG